MLFVFLTDWAAETVGDVIDISIKVSNRQSLVYDAKNCAPARRQQNRTPPAMTAVLLSAWHKKQRNPRISPKFCVKSRQL